MTIETAYIDAFTGVATAWIETGASPYLNDSDANYISTTTNGVLEGNWSFPDSTGVGTINTVKLGLEIFKTGADADKITVEVWDLSAWTALADITCPAVMGWVEVDVSTLLTTWTKINGAHIRITSVKPGAVTWIYVRRLTRIVDYTNIAQQILDENRWTVADISIVNVQSLIDNASHYINLMAGTTIPNIVADALVASDNELMVVKMLTALEIRAHLDRGPNVSIGSISITSVLTDPQYNLFTDMVNKAIEQLKLDAAGTAGIAFAVGTDDADLV